MLCWLYFDKIAPLKLMQTLWLDIFTFPDFRAKSTLLAKWYFKELWHPNRFAPYSSPLIWRHSCLATQWPCIWTWLSREVFLDQNVAKEFFFSLHHFKLDGEKISNGKREQTICLISQDFEPATQNSKFYTQNLLNMTQLLVPKSPLSVKKVGGWGCGSEQTPKMKFRHHETQSMFDVISDRTARQGVKTL